MLIDTMSDWTILDDDDQLRSELKKLKDVEGYPVRTQVSIASGTYKSDIYEELVCLGELNEYTNTYVICLNMT